ncbi:hypothetical protein SELMODRAFT_88599 [Selaginella moellendorffii]|uniref:DNA mismatch repair proteins mutS family domain-containing protein n=1 Tax=Selaginella moellendorffii TaxID=88036 RepID=D8R9L3_SELML|nr:hypothetical protein SELMODRAFT_88599 [Selaginella moellendorffii]
MDEQAARSSGFVVGVIENRAKEVGLAAFDLRTASLHLSQYIETSRSFQNTMTMLHFYNPSELILPATSPAFSSGSVALKAFCSRSDARKVRVLCNLPMQGLLLIQSLALKDSNLCMSQGYSKQYYLCLGAAAAVVKWIESEKGVLLTNNSLRITFNGSADHMSIDITSVQSLQVIESSALAPINKLKKCGSLFGILSKTKSTGGARLLRANLLQPLRDMDTINTRLDCMDELTSKENLFFGLNQVLQRFPKDLDRVISHFCFKPKKLGEGSSRSQSVVASVVLLKEAMELLPALLQVLQDAESTFFQRVKQTVCMRQCFSFIKQRIQETISEDVFNARMPFVARTQQCFAVKPGIDGFLDVARKIFCDTSEAIHCLAKSYRENFQLPSLKLLYNKSKGFSISIPMAEFEQAGLPKTFIQVVKHAKYVHCSTIELISLNTRNKKAADDCYARTEHCLEALTQDIREHVPSLMLLSESLSLIDMITAFASMVSLKPAGSYVRPEFTEDGPIAIETGRHPILESLPSGDFVANNTFLSEASNMVIVTGPNMSGKSTYLHQVALITILAHIGCYVPAQFASFRVVDRLFTRIGEADDMEMNSSSFMREMREAAYFVQNVTPRSLILIDELGRSTSSYDGLALAWSFSEYLLSLKAYVIFATHMQKLGELSTIYPNVKVSFFAVNINNNRLNFEFTLREGCTSIAHYGLLLSNVVGLPPSVIQGARRVIDALESRESKALETYRLSSTGRSLQKDYHVAQRLLTLKQAKMEPDVLRGYLAKLQQSCLE